MRHKWDSKITKKIRFKTCINCGTVYQSGFPSLYIREYSDEPYFLAGDCDKIKILNADSRKAKRIHP